MTLLMAFGGMMAAYSSFATERIHLTCDGLLREEVKASVEKKKFGCIIYKNETTVRVRAKHHFFQDCRSDDLAYWCETPPPALGISAKNTIYINRVTGEVFQTSLLDKPTQFIDNWIFEGFCTMSDQPIID